jgi:hypothetical protein
LKDLQAKRLERFTEPRSVLEQALFKKLRPHRVFGIGLGPEDFDEKFRSVIDEVRDVYSSFHVSPLKKGDFEKLCSFKLQKAYSD